MTSVTYGWHGGCGGCLGRIDCWSKRCPGDEPKFPGVSCYIVGTPQASLRKFEAVLVEKKDWDHVEAGVEVKLVPSPDGEETLILAHSAERREKERAIHEHFLQRMQDGLQKLPAAMESGRLHDESTAHRH